MDKINKLLKVAFIRQIFGLSFAKFLVIDSPNFWSFIRQIFGH